MASCNAESLLENFQFIGLTPDDAVLAKCIELCITYNINEEELVDRWAAFTISNLKNAPPSIEGLQAMERRELSKCLATNVITTPKTKTPKKPAIKTPNNKSAINNGGSLGSTPKRTNTPIVSMSQEISQSVSFSQIGNFADREGAGKVIVSFGPTPKYLQCIEPVYIKLSGETNLTNDTMQMFCHLKKQRISLATINDHIVEMIAKKYDLSLPEYFSRDGSQDTFYGTIANSISGKLNGKAALLELPFGDYAKGEKIPLNLSQLSTYSLFPGQNVIVQGKLQKGTINVTNLYTDGFISPSQSLKMNAPLQIITACGPFTIPNNLRYEPLQELLQIVRTEKPDVLILTGPFLGSEHDNTSTMNEDYEIFFDSLVESIMAPLQGMNIQVVLVSSSRDVFHFPVYPTPPYPKFSFPNLICAPDPCILDIQGFHVAVTTVDPIFNIAKEEVSYPLGSTDRMTTLSQYLLNQLSFCPVYASNVPVDYELMEKYGLMGASPHLLIIPSNFKCFAKKINGCTVINPERLVKGYSGGTYARLNITTREFVNVSGEIITV